MRPEVERYFETTFGGISGFIRAGARRGINRESVEAAAEEIYDRRHGFTSRTVLGQRVIPLAKTFKIPAGDTHERLENLERIVARLTRPWWQKLIDYSKYGGLP